MFQPRFSAGAKRLGPRAAPFRRRVPSRPLPQSTFPGFAQPPVVAPDRVRSAAGRAGLHISRVTLSRRSAQRGQDCSHAPRQRSRETTPAHPMTRPVRLTAPLANRLSAGSLTLNAVPPAARDCACAAPSNRPPHRRVTPTGTRSASVPARLRSGIQSLVSRTSHLPLGR